MFVVVGEPNHKHVCGGLGEKPTPCIVMPKTPLCVVVIFGAKPPFVCGGLGAKLPLFVVYCFKLGAKPLLIVCVCLGANPQLLVWWCGTKTTTMCVVFWHPKPLLLLLAPRVTNQHFVSCRFGYQTTTICCGGLGPNPPCVCVVVVWFPKTII